MTDDKIVEAMARAMMNSARWSSFFSEEDCRVMASAALSVARPMIEAQRWLPIESAPHGEDVLLGWWNHDGLDIADWATEIGHASHGWRRGSISNMSHHGCATHWMPLPSPPATGENENG